MIRWRLIRKFAFIVPSAAEKEKGHDWNCKIQGQRIHLSAPLKNLAPNRRFTNGVHPLATGQKLPEPPTKHFINPVVEPIVFDSKPDVEF